MKKNFFTRDAEKNLSPLTSHFSREAKRYAFTLAEVLITLGIIGVVAALTISIIIAEYQKRVYVTKLHKICRDLQQASEMYMHEQGVSNLRDAGLTNRRAMANFLNTYFIVIKTCDEKTGRAPCFSKEYYKSIDGTSKQSAALSWGQAHAFVLSDGVAVMPDHPAMYKLTVNGVTSYFGHMLIDVNASKGPNIAGRDLFYAEFYDDGSIDVAGCTPACRHSGICENNLPPRDIRENLYKSSCKSQYYGRGCIGKIINDGWKMNY